MAQAAQRASTFAQFDGPNLRRPPPRLRRVSDDEVEAESWARSAVPLVPKPLQPHGAQALDFVFCRLQRPGFAAEKQSCGLLGAHGLVRSHRKAVAPGAAPHRLLLHAHEFPSHGVWPAGQVPAAHQPELAVHILDALLDQADKVGARIVQHAPQHLDQFLLPGESTNIFAHPTEAKLRDATEIIQRVCDPAVPRAGGDELLNDGCHSGVGISSPSLEVHPHSRRHMQVWPLAANLRHPEFPGELAVEVAPMRPCRCDSSNLHALHQPQEGTALHSASQSTLHRRLLCRPQEVDARAVTATQRTQERAVDEFQISCTADKGAVDLVSACSGEGCMWRSWAPDKV
mmetsp:Transcript_57657/g.166982  ORF Transcript_57657/g.166982 Transcript_57657/m.166982 type:complete len:344 (-) Transcript_57657:505-1536(-)